MGFPGTGRGGNVIYPQTGAIMGKVAGGILGDATRRSRTSRALADLQQIPRDVPPGQYAGMVAQVLGQYGLEAGPITQMLVTGQRDEWAASARSRAADAEEERRMDAILGFASAFGPTGGGGQSPVPQGVQETSHPGALMRGQIPLGSPTPETDQAAATGALARGPADPLDSIRARLRAEAGGAPPAPSPGAAAAPQGLSDPRATLGARYRQIAGGFLRAGEINKAAEYLGKAEEADAQWYATAKEEGLAASELQGKRLAAEPGARQDAQIYAEISEPSLAGIPVVQDWIRAKAGDASVKWDAAKEEAFGMARAIPGLRLRLREAGPMGLYAEGLRLTDQGGLYLDPVTRVPQRLKDLSEMQGTTVEVGRALGELRADSAEIVSLLSHPDVQRAFGGAISEDATLRAAPIGAVAQKVLNAIAKQEQRWGIQDEQRVAEAVAQIERVASGIRVKYAGAAQSAQELRNMLPWIPDSADSWGTLSAKVNVLKRKSDAEFQRWGDTHRNQYNLAPIYRAFGVDPWAPESNQIPNLPVRGVTGLDRRPPAAPGPGGGVQISPQSIQRE